jgi:hypothetical protein
VKLTGLSLDKIPPIGTPLNFFLIAPVFGVLAGILLIGFPELLTNRWLPATLAFTHLLTLGVGAMVMLGGLFQVLPVVSNRSIPGDQVIAPWVHQAMVWGTLTLTAGFLTSWGWLIGLAAFLLASGFGLFVSAFGTGLVRARPAGDTTVALRLAALSLVATLVLGGMQLSLHLWPEAGLYRPHQTQLHAFVGAFGWVLLLVMGVSFQVIPMFHVAPAFPRWVCRRLTLVVFSANAVVLLAGHPVAAYALPLTMVATILYATEALKVLMARKRKLVDYTVRFWQLGLTQLIAAALLALGLTFTEGGAWRAPVELALGLVFALGFVLSVMLGMLQKIVPFLIFLHLQRMTLTNPTSVMMKLPHMRALLPTGRMRWQYRLQLVLLPCIYLAPWLPWMAVIAGLLLVAAFGWLGYCLWGAWHQYQKVESEMQGLISGCG